MHLLLGQLTPALLGWDLGSLLVRKFLRRSSKPSWNAWLPSAGIPEPPKSGYRAVYLHQVTPDHSLFGWLYNDGADDLGHRDVPYFICYYLAGPLHAVKLENIFYLPAGTSSTIDRHSISTTKLFKLMGYPRPPWGGDRLRCA